MSKKKIDIQLTRAYGAPKKHRYRILVDRIWPRGIKKDDLDVDEWLKEIAPSDKLRKWFDHDPAKWDEFRKRYHAELEKNSEQVDGLLETVRKKPVELVFGAKDEEHNQAVALKQYLELRAKA